MFECTMEHTYFMPHLPKYCHELIFECISYMNGHKALAFFKIKAATRRVQLISCAKRDGAGSTASSFTTSYGVNLHIFLH